MPTHENPALLTELLSMEKLARTVSDGLSLPGLTCSVAFGSPVLFTLIDMFLTSISWLGTKDCDRFAWDISVSFNMPSGSGMSEDMFSLSVRVMLLFWFS